MVVPEKWCTTDGWTDRKKVHRGGCPTQKNIEERIYTFKHPVVNNNKF